MEYDPFPAHPSAEPQSATPDAEPPEHQRQRRHLRRRLFFWVVLPIATLILSIFSGVLVGASIKKPEVETLDEFVPRLMTELFDRSGNVFQTYARENRILLDETEIPKLLQQAILAAEDSNFFVHGGIDLKGIARAAYKNLREGRKKEGASTITMQLARELFLSRDKKWTRKIEEAFLAVELEKKYSKQQILTLYCNLVNLSQGNYGMEAASRNYFNKPVGELTLPEAATLAGIPQRPSHYNVYKRPEAVIKRRNLVLGRMLSEGFITEQQHDRAVAEPLLIVPRRREGSVGPYFSEEVRRYLASTYGSMALYDRGLRVHTTLDRKIQRAAESALRDGLARLDHRSGWRQQTLDHLEGDDLESRQLPAWTNEPLIDGEWYKGIVLSADAQQAQIKIGDSQHTLGRAGIEWTRKKKPSDLLTRGDVAWFRMATAEDGSDKILYLEQEPEIEGAAVVIESSTGAVRAMVGGWDYDRNEFNRITQARRQVGSAFKVFVFGAALEIGFTAADTLFDGPVVFAGAAGGPTYSPRNYYRKYNGILTLRRALEKSINVTSVKLLDMVGAEQVIDFSRRCGIQSELLPYPSLALGAADLHPLELAAAYATIANQGVYVEPYFLEQVVSSTGRVLQGHLPRAHKAMQPEIAHVLSQMLKGVVQRGTAGGPPLNAFDLDMAGKTGTTDAYTDAWFVGFTPRYTLLTWVGYDKKRSLGRGMTGAAAALPIWAQIVDRGLEEGWVTAGETFAEPLGIVNVAIDYETGLLAAPGSERTIQESFVDGTEPVKRFETRWGRIIRLPWYQQEPFYLPKEGERMPGQIEDWSLVQEAWRTKERGPA